MLGWRVVSQYVIVVEGMHVVVILVPMRERKVYV